MVFCVRKWIDIGIPRIRVYELEYGKHYKVFARHKDHRNKWIYGKGQDVYGGKPQVRDCAYEMLANYEKGSAAKDSNITIEELCNNFIQKRESLKLVRETTIENDKFLIKWINWSLGEYVVKKLNKTDIEQAIRKLRKASVSDYRIFKIIAKLKQILETAIDDEIILKNPCRGITLRTSDEYAIRKKERFISTSEILRLKQLLQEKQKTATYVAMYVALLTGMRRGEILALLWKDIDFEQKTIKIYKQLSKKREIIIPKTKKSVRVVDMPTILVEYLLDWKEIQKNWAIQKHIKFTSEIPVISNESLNFIRPDNLRRTWTGFFIRNDFARVDENGSYIGPHFHSLRDAHASLLFNSGAREKEVQERLGHSQIRTTMDIYTSVFQETRKKTAETVDRFFETKPTT